MKKRPGLRIFRLFFLAPLLCIGGAWWLSGWDKVQRIEWRTLDWRTAVRVAYQPPPDPRVSIVLFGDDTDANLVTWPPDRAVHGDMIKLLSLAHPKVIAWDVILDAIREGEGDAQMARAARLALRSGAKVITAAATSVEPVEDAAGPEHAGPTRPIKEVQGDKSALTGDAYAVRPFPDLRRESLYGYADTPHSEDGIQREVPLVVRVGNEVYPGFALQTLMAYFDVPVDKVRVRLGDAVYLTTPKHGELRVPVLPNGRYLLNYRYDQDDAGTDFHTLEYRTAMLSLNAKYVEQQPVGAVLEADIARLRGGIVLLGQVVLGKADAGATARSGYSPLVLVHANLINNVLAHDYIRFAPRWLVWGGTLAMGYLGLLLGLRRSVWMLAAFTVLGLGLYVAAAFALWIKWSVWLPFVGPLTGFAVLQFVVIGRRALQEQHGREQVKQMFGTYLSPELLKKMMKDGVNVASVSSERRPVTILFSDLRDFTAMTERMGDADLIAQLNEYLAAMVDCIHHEGGTLHKFIGDAVMAVWGDLGSEGPAEDARKAVRAALGMQVRLAELNEGWRAAGKPEFRMGIGLNHGTVLIGNIGSPRRMEFTAIGDAVNLASRLESLNKELKTTLLIGESVRELLGEEYPFRPCGAVPVKGKSRPVAVFSIDAGAAPQASPS